MAASLRVFGAPGRYLQGPGAIAAMGEYLARLGAHAALVADRMVLDIAGERIVAACSAAGVRCEPVEFSGEIVPAEVERLAGMVAKTKADLIIGCGGGKGIDAGKGVAHALRLGHPFDLGWALSLAADLLDHRGKPEEVRKRAEEIVRLGRENSLPFLWACMAPGRTGIALIHEGRAAQGVEMVKAPMAIWDASGGKVWSPYFKAVLAEGMAMLGYLDGALQLIDEQIAQVERPGWEERVHYAEILRLKGWILSLKGDLEGAEQNYLASLDWARQQQAKSWELHTSTSLARLWRSQGKRKEALELLKPVYDWFTEGFDTKDLKEAKALLEELGG